MWENCHDYDPEVERDMEQRRKAASTPPPSDHRATCQVCGDTFRKDTPFENVFCPSCPSSGIRGVLHSEPFQTIPLVEDIERLKDAKDRLYQDALIGHRWFEKHFGDGFNGRDFAIKCPMADAEIARLTRELAEARESSARLILALEKQRCSCPVLLMCPHCGGNVTEGEDQYAGSWICGACVRTVSLTKDHSRPCLRCIALYAARKERG